MASVTLSEMLTAIRQRANIENQYGFIPETELRGYLNYCLRDVRDKLVAAGGQDWFRTSKVITTNGTDETYDLPPDFYRLISVDVDFGAGLLLSAKPYMESERNAYRAFPFVVGWTWGRPVRYRLQGSKISFLPKPSGTYSVTLNYVPTFVPLVKANDVVPGLPDGWEEHAIWRAVGYCKSKGEEDPSYALQEVQRLDARINEMAQDRDQGHGERPVDAFAEDLLPWGF